MGGTVVSETLDQLSKELVRLKQERTISAKVLLAETNRRIREAEQAGMRQAEHVLRKREEVMFRELMSTQQGTVDSYLYDIIGETIRGSAKEQALEEVQLRSNYLNNVVDYIEDTHNKPHIIVKDLMQQFLYPHVQRERLKRRVIHEEKRFLETSKKLLQAATDKAENKLKEDPTDMGKWDPDEDQDDEIKND